MNELEVEKWSARKTIRIKKYTHKEGRVCCWLCACHPGGGGGGQDAGETAGDHGPCLSPLH